VAIAVPFQHKYLLFYGEPLWLSGKVVKNEKINEIERTLGSLPTPGNLFFNLF
jgi:hypothetical protein